MGNNLAWKKTTTVSRINLIITAGFLFDFNSTISFDWREETATLALFRAGMAA